MKKFLKIAGIATLVAVVGAIAVGAVVFAQEPPWKPHFPMRMPFNGPFGGERGGIPFGPMDGGFEKAGVYREQMHAALAEALGLSVEELDAAVADGQTLSQIAEAQGVDLADVQTALETAGQDLLQQAVTDGLLTQEQADRISERMAGHGFGKRGPIPFRGTEQAEAHREQMHADVAEALGLSVEEFDAAIAEGQTLAQIAEAQGVDLQTVYETMAADRQEVMRQAIEQAVEDGQMSREQADWLLQGLEQGWMGGRGFRGHSFRPGGFNPEGRGWPQGSVRPGQ